VEATAINARTRRLAAWSLGLGITGLLTTIAGIGVLLAIAALVCGAIALAELRPWHPHDGHGWALTGIIFALAAVLAFPLLLSTAVPRFITSHRAKEHAQCYANLQRIAEAKTQWSTTHHATNGTVITLAELGEGVVSLTCPGKGHYKANAVGASPECSVAAHNLKPLRRM
jgi:hypothetical protein